MDAVFWRRRAAAIAVAVIGLLLIVIVVRGCGGNGEAPSRAATTPKPKPLAQLPRGGRQLLPKYRVVAYDGAPQDAELGTLGIGTPTAAGKRLLRTAAGYRSLGRPVMPAMELIASVANASPGDDGTYRTRQPAAVIDRYLKAARAIKGILILDIQPGYVDFLTEARRLEPWLKQPDVMLARSVGLKQVTVNVTVDDLLDVGAP